MPDLDFIQNPELNLVTFGNREPYGLVQHANGRWNAWVTHEDQAAVMQHASTRRGRIYPTGNVLVQPPRRCLHRTDKTSHHYGHKTPEAAYRSLIKDVLATHPLMWPILIYWLRRFRRKGVLP